MLKNTHILPKRVSFKRISRYAKRALATNLSLAIITLPVGIPSNTTATSVPETSLIISQEKLDVAFNVSANESNKVQIPIEFNYMSQKFSSYHPGVDLATKYGTPIKPFEAGTVIETGFSPFGYGKEIIIDHGDGVESLYAHLSKILVKKGDKVTVDTEIGLVGMTGRTTGPHLHLEIHKNGKAINPLSVLPFNQNSLLLSSKPVTSNRQ